MPFLVFKSIDEKKVCSISKIIIEEVVQLLQCNKNSVNIEVISSSFIKDGQVTKRNPLVEISWFDKGQEIQDNLAYIITKHVQSLGYPTVDIIVYPLEAKRFYKNGAHY